MFDTTEFDKEIETMEKEILDAMTKLDIERCLNEVIEELDHFMWMMGF